VRAAEQDEREADSEFAGEVAYSSIAVGQGRRDEDDAATGKRGWPRLRTGPSMPPSGGVVDDQLAASHGGEFRR